MVIPVTEIIKMEHHEEKKVAKYQGLGWKVKIQQRHESYYVVLAKEIMFGNALKKGSELFTYLVDCEGRKALMVYLDQKEREIDQSVATSTISF